MNPHAPGNRLSFELKNEKEPSLIITGYRETVVNNEVDDPGYSLFQRTR
jgi:hypothetical protein